jgi:hypothetical protein
MSLICQTQLTCGETFNGTLFDGDDQDHWPGYLTDHFAYQQALGIESTITVSAAYDKRLEVTGPGGTTVHTADANGDIVAVRSGEGAFELALSNNGVILDDGSYSIKVSCAAVTPVPTTPPPTTIPPTTTVDPTTTTIPTTAPPTTAPPTTIPPTTTVDPTSTTIPTTAPPTATPSPTPVAQVDTDRDGLFNDDEGTRGTNPNNRDTDGDGWEDGLEVAIGTDPLDPTSPADDTDADDDGIPDSFDHDPTSGDSDGDGFRDFFELAWGSDPNDPNSIPGLGDVTNDGVPDNVDAVAIIEFFLERLTMDFPDYFGDLNRDGVVDNVDAVILFNWYVGNIALLPLDRP